MIDELLIAPSLLALFALFAAAVKVAEKQYEHAFTRGLVAVFYFVIAIVSLQIEMSRLLARWFWLLLFGVEILSWCVMQLWRRKNER